MCTNFYVVFSAGSTVISPVSFLILVIFVFSLSIIISLARGLSILLIFPPKNQLFVSLIFSIVFLFSISLISSLIIIIYFLLLALGLFCSFFKLVWKYRLLTKGISSLHLSVYCYKYSSKQYFSWILLVFICCVFVNQFKLFSYIHWDFLFDL